MSLIIEKILWIYYCIVFKVRDNQIDIKIGLL